MHVADGLVRPMALEGVMRPSDERHGTQLLTVTRRLADPGADTHIEKDHQGGDNAQRNVGR